MIRYIKLLSALDIIFESLASTNTSGATDHHEMCNIGPLLSQEVGARMTSIRFNTSLKKPVFQIAAIVFLCQTNGFR